MEKSATSAQVSLAFSLLGIRSYFGELITHLFFADAGGAEFRDERVHVHGFAVDCGLADKLLVDGLSSNTTARAER
jgi:hypothetical protein